MTNYLVVMIFLTVALTPFPSPTGEGCPSVKG